MLRLGIRNRLRRRTILPRWVGVEVGGVGDELEGVGDGNRNKMKASRQFLA